MHADSCGRKGIGETPKRSAQGGSPAARGKRSVFPEWCQGISCFRVHLSLLRCGFLATKKAKKL
ncbi:hypothetical protein [Lentibacillus amyloliquefaciens]|uniref:hypothetical protein n=1 Tax=Lentibacillus amyloliquefaciens TaxID=1472767 RepID=UPI001F4126EE|nr:hypothetical protein [Lentibacillus amyloliquefaciens]